MDCKKDSYLMFPYLAQNRCWVMTPSEISAHVAKEQIIPILDKNASLSHKTPEQPYVDVFIHFWPTSPQNADVSCDSRLIYIWIQPCTCSYLVHIKAELSKESRA